VRVRLTGVLLVVALCAGSVNSDRPSSPVRIAMKRFFKLFIIKE
jgi:hypothetical protein